MEDLEYEVKELREDIPKLSSVFSNDIFNPVLEVCIRRFLRELRDPPNKYGVTDIRSIEFTFEENYAVAVEGKIILIGLDKESLWPGLEKTRCYDPDEDLPGLTQAIYFEATSKSEDVTKKLFQNFRDFVSTQKLESLLRDSEEEVRKLLPYISDRNLIDFYLNEGWRKLFT